MVANGGGSIPATPEMMAAQPNTREWIRAWVESFEGDIQAEADVLSAKLVSKGFHSRRSLRGMRGRSEQELADLLDVPFGVASEFKQEAEEMHGGGAANGAVPMMAMLGGGDDGSAKPSTWREFTIKLRGDGAQLKVPTKKELDVLGARLIPYAAAQDGAAAGVAREFIEKQGCDGTKFGQIELKLGNYESSQPAAAIMSGLDPRMVTYATGQVGAAAGGLQMPRALHEPCYSIPLEDRMAEEVTILKSRKVF